VRGDGLLALIVPIGWTARHVGSYGLKGQWVDTYGRRSDADLWVFSHVKMRKWRRGWDSTVRRIRLNTV
jgi:hypothetical protein